MLQYIVKRCAYSIFILFGVLILTFLLFRIAAGDPSGVLLGKNPTPQDVENLRRSLGVDKPLFWGKWKKTECFSSALFEKSRTNFPGITYEGNPVAGEDCLTLTTENEAILFQRNFPLEQEKIRLRVRGNGTVDINNTSILLDPDE